MRPPAHDINHIKIRFPIGLSADPCSVNRVGARPHGGAGLFCVFSDEVHDWLRVPGRQRIMSFAFFNDDDDLPAEFPISAFPAPGSDSQARGRGCRKRGAAARRSWPAGPGYRATGVFNIWLRRTGFSRIDARDLVRMLDGPGVRFPPCPAAPSRTGFREKAVPDQVIVNSLPTGARGPSAL